MSDNNDNTQPLSEAQLAEIRAAKRYFADFPGQQMREATNGAYVYAAPFDALLREVERLMQRLECYADDDDGRRVRLPESCDGIACRNDTIKLQDDRIDSLESALATSAARVAELEAECAVHVEALQQYQREQERDSEHLANVTALAMAGTRAGADYEARLEASASRERGLREALVHAVSVIQDWHNMGVATKEASHLWDIYWRNAPELTPIRAALVTPPSPVTAGAATADERT